MTVENTTSLTALTWLFLVFILPFTLVSFFIYSHFTRPGGIFASTTRARSKMIKPIQKWAILHTLITNLHKNLDRTKFIFDLDMNGTDLIDKINQYRQYFNIPPR